MSDIPLPPEEPKVQEGVAIQPAMHFAPGPITVNITAQQQPNGQKIIIFHMEHLAGSTFAALDPAYAKALGEKLIEQATGIQIAPANSRIIHG